MQPPSPPPPAAPALHSWGAVPGLLLLLHPAAGDGDATGRRETYLGNGSIQGKTMSLGSPSSTRRWRGANPLPVSRNSSVPALAPPPLLLPLVQRSPSSTAPQDEAARPSICSLGGPRKASQMSPYLLVL